MRSQAAFGCALALGLGCAIDTDAGRGGAGSAGLGDVHRSVDVEDLSEIGADPKCEYSGDEYCNLEGTGCEIWQGCMPPSRCDRLNCYAQCMEDEDASHLCGAPVGVANYCWNTVCAASCVGQCGEYGNVCGCDLECGERDDCCPDYAHQCIVQ